MTQKLERLFSIILILALLLALAPAQLSTAAPPPELFFSEYVEGSSFNKALEIYNGTGASIDLAVGDYDIYMSFNGGTSTFTIDLTGSVASGDVYVVAPTNATDPTILAQADQKAGTSWFNGDDAVLLRKGTVPVDVIGQVGTDPGSEWGSGLTSTADNTLRRNANICQGDPDGSNAFDPSLEWTGYATNTFDGLGSHTANCVVVLDPKINEFSASTTGTDVEYVEVFGSPSTDYSAYTILEIEGDGSGAGVIDEVIAVGTTDASGFWLGNLPANALENGTLTLLLVKDFTGALTNDLDTDNNGVFDTTPWTAILDGVAVNDGTVGDLTYASPSLGPNYDGVNSFAPGGASRIPDGFDTDLASDWVRNDFDLAGIPGYIGTLGPGEALNTPGAANQVYVPQPIIANCGSPLASAVGFAADQSVTASDADGMVTNISIDSVTPVPASGTISLGSLVPAAGVGGTASAIVTVDAAVPVGSYSVQITAANNDATPQTGSCTLDVTVLSILPIGAVQGTVTDSDNGLTHRSPYAPPSGNSSSTARVAVQGVIYEKTIARTSSGASQYGFFLQNTAASADSDPNSSDGVFVFMGGFSDLIGGYVPQVGDEVVIHAKVADYFNLTELTSASAIAVVQSGLDVNAEIPTFEVNPPDNLADANRYWERHEGMRAQVLANSIAIDGRDVFPSTADAEIWLARGDNPIALRDDPYDRRAFRDPHPVDNDPALFDDGNGYRIILGSLGLKAVAGDNTVLLAPARTFDTISNALDGGVYFSFSKYQIMVVQQPQLTQGADPALNSPPQIFNRAAEYSLAPYNVENLYDYRDDPFDGCDFAANLGCPGVDPPFDYVPASEAAYLAHLNDIAQQIITDLHSPDILFVQEAEDQDICTVSGGALVCGITNDADGKPDTLQDLALAIAGFGGPAYDAAYDRDGADDRGIVSGFLYRTDRVELLPAADDDPVLGSSPTVDYRDTPLAYNTDVQNPKALNADLPEDVDITTGVDGNNVFTRPPQVGLFRIWREATGSGAYLDLYAISNHFSSTPDARVGQRTEQSLYNAAIVTALQTANPDVKVSVGGDFNVYPRPDDPFTPESPLYPTDQLGPLYDQGLNNLFDALLAADDDSAYSYIFQGQTQTLDQIFVTSSLLADLTQARAAHVNADFPADFFGDVARGASDHDPLVARFCRVANTVTVTADPSVLWPPKHQYVDVMATVNVSDGSEPGPTVTLVSVTSNEPDNGEDDGDTINDIVIVDDFNFKLRAERSGLGTGRIYTITYKVTDACGFETTQSVTVKVPISMGQVFFPLIK